MQYIVPSILPLCFIVPSIMPSIVPSIPLFIRLGYRAESSRNATPTIGPQLVKTHDIHTLIGSQLYRTNPQ